MLSQTIEDGLLPQTIGEYGLLPQTIGDDSLLPQKIADDGFPALTSNLCIYINQI